jgi:catechol 2,3-dioxygenase-like lactoylglutathione lyase family enzyme
MRLAKPCIDVGLFTNNLEVMLRFWQEEVGLPFEELLPLGGGSRQHRHAMNGSVFKLNESRDAVPPGPLAGYRELLIAREGLNGPHTLTDPDGNRVTLIPPGTEGVTGIGVRLAVRDEAAFHRFYGQALGLEAAGPKAYRWGTSVLLFEHDATATRTEEMRGTGFRYLTVQVRDVDAEHRALLAKGVEEGRPPATLGATARISFIRDPDGNWVEVSQRASLTGPLPPA